MRLQNDGTWRELTPDRNLFHLDYTAKEISDIKAKSQINIAFELAGKTINIGPGSDKEVVVHEKSLNLSYTSCVFRKLFPNNPNYNQMIQAVSRGNDFYNNALILNVNGEFELRREYFDGSVGNDPSIVARHDTFFAGNGYVGLKALQGGRDWLENLYRTSLKCWKDHLISHRTQEHVNYNLVDSLEGIRRDLEKIKENWLPEY